MKHGGGGADYNVTGNIKIDGEMMAASETIGGEFEFTCLEAAHRRHLDFPT